MDHVFLPERNVATPWRTAAIVAAGIAAAELFLLVLVGVVFGAKLVSDRAEEAVVAGPAAKTAATAPTAAPKTSPKSGPAKPAPAAQLPRNRTSVIVLNGNGIAGAAGTVAEQVRGFRYIIAATGNAPRSDFKRSIVMYRPGREGEARRLARDLHLRRVAPLDGLTMRDLQGAHLALIIGG